MTEQLTEGRSESGSEGSEGKVADGPIRVSWAPVPKVNLLPIEIIEGRRFRRTQVVLGAAILGSVLIAGGGTFWAQKGIDTANQQLLLAQSRIAALSAEQARYAAVPLVISQLDAATAARALAMSTDVLWYRYLNDIDAARPAGVYLSGITLTMGTGATSATAAAPAATNPLALAGVGTILVNGTANQYRDVSSWLEALNKIPGFASSSLSSASEVDHNVTFGSSAVITEAAESGRYPKKAS